jgi:hypothetical protein
MDGSIAPSIHDEAMKFRRVGVAHHDGRPITRPLVTLEYVADGLDARRRDASGSHFRWIGELMRGTDGPLPHSAVWSTSSTSAGSA